MRQLVLIILTLNLATCAGSQPSTSTPPDPQNDGGSGSAPDAATPEQSSSDNEFVTRDSDAAGSDHPSKIKASDTEAALKFFVIDKENKPIGGIVISVTGPDGKRFYTKETDAEGYAEVLVPVGQKYDLVYLSLGRRDIAAKVSVTDEARQNIKLTLRYKRYDRPAGAEPPRFILEGIEFDTAKATIRPESYPRLDNVVEYMTHKPNARIEIAGHTDNVGKPQSNKVLSLKRAQSCRDYLISKGIDGGRITAVGHGDERPIAPNDTEEGRQKNRRIEATEL